MESDWKKNPLFPHNPYLESLLEEPKPDPEYETFKAEFKKRKGILLDLYKEKQMRRRINTLMERKGIANYSSFLSFLDTHPTEMDYFIDYITINVTEFFRSPEHWNFVKDNALSQLIQSPKKKIRIWSCACSTGEEPYSLAMNLYQLTGDLSRFEIIASDIDRKVLLKAKEANYNEEGLENVPPEFKDHYFTKTGETYHLKEEISSAVEFRKLDLLQEEFPSECDLILCQNILIYFTDEAKDKIYLQLQNALTPGGYLFTGSAEQIIYYRKYDLNKLSGYLYQKKANE